MKRILILFSLILFSANIYGEKKYELYKITNTKVLQKKIKEIEKKQKKSKEDLIKLVILYHNLGIYKKEANTTRKILEKIEKIYDRHKDALIMAYYGSALTLMGRDLKNPIKKISYVKKGLKYIDRAIKKKPDSIFLRMIRGSNNYNLPSFFKRIDYVIEDFEWIIKNGEDKIKKETLTEVYYKLGNAYKKIGKIEKAIEMWKKARDMQTGEYSKKAREILEIFEE